MAVRKDSFCKGVDDTNSWSPLATPEQMQKLGVLFQKFKEYAPHFEGPAKAEDAIRDVLATIRRASIADGFGGAFVSHRGDKQWL